MPNDILRAIAVIRQKGRTADAQLCELLLKERDRLAEKVRELEGELPGKLKGERALADEQIRCFHEQAVNAEQERDRLRRENNDLQRCVTGYDGEMRELVRLRGLIGALPLYGDNYDYDLLVIKQWEGADALAGLLKERQKLAEDNAPKT